MRSATACSDRLTPPCRQQQTVRQHRRAVRVGKSTVVRLLGRLLVARGVPHRLTAEPTKGDIGQRARCLDRYDGHQADRTCYLPTETLRRTPYALPAN